MATSEELQTQINILEKQLESLSNDLNEGSKNGQEMFNIGQFNNYDHLADEAEGAFLKKEYLEAFLIQSCIFEGVLKEYAEKKLLTIISQSVVLGKKFKNFELARITDELFIAGKINKQLYEDLNCYRKKRNNVIHDLLKYENKEKLNEELKITYESGKHMKVFIVNDLSEEIKRGVTAEELQAQINSLMLQLEDLKSQLQA